MAFQHHRRQPKGLPPPSPGAGMTSTVEAPGRPVGLNYIGGGWQPAVTG